MTEQDLQTIAVMAKQHHTRITNLMIGLKNHRDPSLSHWLYPIHCEADAIANRLDEIAFHKTDNDPETTTEPLPVPVGPKTTKPTSEPEPIPEPPPTVGAIETDDLFAATYQEVESEAKPVPDPTGEAMKLVDDQPPKRKPIHKSTPPTF